MYSSLAILVGLGLGIVIEDHVDPDLELPILHTGLIRDRVERVGACSG